MTFKLWAEPESASKLPNMDAANWNRVLLLSVSDQKAKAQTIFMKHSRDFFFS